MHTYTQRNIDNYVMFNKFINLYCEKESFKCKLQILQLIHRHAHTYMYTKQGNDYQRDV